LPPERIEHYFLPRLFAEIAAADMIDGVLDAARSLRPDLVVFGSCAYAGPLAAAVCNVASVCLQVEFPPAAETQALVADAVSPLWADLGQPIDRRRSVHGDLVLDMVPASLAKQSETDTPALALRPTLAPTLAPAPEMPPLVHVTFGTMLHHDLAALRCVVDALADEPVHVLATIGNDDEPPWGADALPANAAVERYVPHEVLLPRCSVVVHHGGAGTMYASLAHGLPQIIVPTGADQFTNAAMISKAGLGLTMGTDALAPEAVRGAVGSVLGNEMMRARAEAVAREIRTMPDAATVAATLRARFRSPAPPDQAATHS
jgi:hypothetical protein